MLGDYSTSSSVNRNKYILTESEYIILNEDITDIFDSCIEIFKNILSLVRKCASFLFKKLKIGELADILYKGIKSLPLIGDLLPDRDSKEEKIRRELSTISIGNGVAVATSLITDITNSIWEYIPVTSDFKNNVLLPMFNYNQRKTFLQSLYKMMLDAEINPKYANAYIIILAMKIPLYNMLLVFKPFGSKDIKRSKPTIDDESHPFTSGDPIYTDQGLNETEVKLQNLVKKFIQIQKTSLSELDAARKLTWQLIKDAIVAIIIPLLLPMFNAVKFAFGLKDDNKFHVYFDPLLKFIICLYYYYFLITSIILASLAVSNEEEINPSKTKEETDTSKIGEFEEV